jgi:hypothetical protein
MSSISKESAQEQFLKLCEYYGVSYTFNTKERTDDMNQKYNFFDQFVSFICDGKISIESDDKGRPVIVQYLKYCDSVKQDSIKYYPMTGAVARLSKQGYEFLGALSKEGPKFFDLLEGSDIVMSQNINSFFFVLQL